MPRNQFQRTIFALMTVFITVHSYVFYSLYVVNGSTFLSLVPEATGVLDAINKMGGVYMCGRNVPIWTVVALEFVLAITLETAYGKPLFVQTCKQGV